MKTGITLVPERLQLIRQFRRLSVEALASKLQVSRQAIAQYEQGQTSPSPRIFKNMQAVLQIPAVWFTKPLKEPQATPSLTVCAELFSVLNKYIKFPMYQPPLLTSNDPMQTAMDLREAWQLGTIPAFHLPLVLEAHGIVVFNCPIAGIDTVLYQGCQLVLMNTADKSNVALRFSLSQAVGQFVFPKDPVAFARAFLLHGIQAPALTVSSICKISEYWGVTPETLLHYWRENQQISDTQYYNARRNLKKHVSVDATPPVLPTLLQRAFSVLLESAVTDTHSLVEDIGLYSTEIETLCLLPTGSLTPTQIK